MNEANSDIKIAISATIAWCKALYKMDRASEHRKCLDDALARFPHHPSFMSERGFVAVEDSDYLLG